MCRFPFQLFRDLPAALRAVRHAWTLYQDRKHEISPTRHNVDVFFPPLTTDVMTQVCTRWQLQTGCLSETTVYIGRTWRQERVSLSKYVAIFSLQRNHRQTHFVKGFDLWRLLFSPRFHECQLCWPNAGSRYWYFPRVLPPRQLLLVSIFSSPDQVYEKRYLSVSILFNQNICWHHMLLQSI